MKRLLILVVRVLTKQKRLFIFSLISLSASMALMILTSGYLAKELSCDKYLSNLNNTYRLVNATSNQVGLEENLYNNLISDFPAIDKVCRFYKVGSMISVEEKIINIENLIIVDSTFFDIFDYNLLTGNKREVLNAPDKIVISQSLARQLFGNENPIGRPIKINMLVTAYVTGIFEDNVNKSHFKTDAIVSLYTKDLPASGGTYWNNNGKWEIKTFNFYLTIKGNTDTSLLASQISAQYQTPWEPQKNNIVLQPLADIYWNNDIEDRSEHANIPLILLLISITIIVLIIAGINYINLSLSNLQAESKIVSVFKLHGALRKNMLQYYALSGFIILGLSFIFALLLSFTFLPSFNQLLLSNINLELLFNSTYLFPFVFFVTLVFLMIGLFPALLFSGINPINLFQGNVSGKMRLSSFSKSLLIFQFVATIILIVSVLMIFKQIKFMKTTNPGFETSYLINQDLHYSIKNRSIIDSYSRELLKNPNILNLSVSEGIPLNIHMYCGQEVNGINISYMNINCDTGFVNLLGMKLLEGRQLLPSDYNGCFITYKLARDCRFEEPLKESIGGMKVIGVVDDIHGESMHHKIQGIVFCLLREKPSNISLKISSSNITNTISYMQKIWGQLFPEYPFNYIFYDDIIARQYDKEQKLAKSISIIAGLAILLCCLGLLGLVVNMVENRTKEIGIHRVNGAKIAEILSMLNKDFVMWVVIAFVIAVPIAWYAMHRWLENFAYKTPMDWWVFGAAGFIVLLITIFTISWQSWNVAKRNPVEALRYE